MVKSLSFVVALVFGMCSAVADLTLSLTKGKESAQSLLSLIYHRYEMSAGLGHDFFAASHNIGKESWEALKYKYGKKILESHLPENRNANSQKSTFIYVFGGSSVTAGHDNYYNQSYPKVFERRMQPIYDALGVDLSVRNIAIGSVGCDPYNACYETFGGTDPDFITWEQSYFCKSSQCAESMARYAASSRNQAVVAFLSSGSPPMLKCVTSSADKIPYSSEQWAPELLGFEEWKPSRKDVEAEMLRMDAFHQTSPTGAGFYRYLKSYHPYIKQYGMEFWASNSKVTDQTMKTGDAILSSCLLKFATKEALIHGSGHGTSSHPTVGKHLMRAELIAWIHAMTILDAVYMIENDISLKGSAHKLIEEYSRVLSSMFPSGLPPPVLCGRGDVHCPAKLQCYSDFEPHFNSGLRLTDLLDTETNWQRTRAGESAERWAKMGYNDSKWRYYSRDDTSPLDIRINVGEIGIVSFCFGDGSPRPNFFVSLNVNEQSHFRDFNNTKWSLVRDSTACGRGRSKVIPIMGVELYEIPKGNHVVRLLGSHVTVTHVIMWPSKL